MTITTLHGAPGASEPPMPDSRVRTVSTFLTVAAAVLVTACGGSAAVPDEPPAAPPPVQLAPSGAATVDSVLVEDGPVLSGTLMAERRAELHPLVSGTVLSVPVREGQAVRAGQTIAVIDTLVLADQARSARLAVQSAEMAAATAGRNLERSTELERAGAIATRDLEAARDMNAQAAAVLEDARARLASARRHLEHGVIRAPFSGVVTELAVHAGDVVQPGSGRVAVVADAATLELEAMVPSSYLAALTPGAAVEFSVAAHPGRVFRGTISRINPAVDPTTGQLRLYARVANPDRALAAGLFAEGRVAVTSMRDLAVPIAALDTRATTPTVKRVRGGVVEVVEIAIGVRDELAGFAQVRSGLVFGDTVLLGAALGTPIGATVQLAPRDR
jgi:RND family efflux transporter MFP subunit